MEELDKEKLGQLLTKLRNTKDLSRDGMGDLLGVSGSTIKRWEKGDAVPSMTDVIHISNKFNISLEEVYEGQISIEREVNRKLASVDSGIDSINDRIASTDETVSNISNDISDIKEQLGKVSVQTISMNEKETKDDLTWFWLLIIHLAATTMGFLCYMMGRMGHFETFLSSIIYVVAICYLIYKKRNDMKCLRLFLLYAVVLEVNFLLNYVLFADMPVEVPGVINNIELLAINGGMYGFCIFDYYHTEPLLLICSIVYTAWIVFCGYHLIRNNVRKERK